MLAGKKMRGKAIWITEILISPFLCEQFLVECPVGLGSRPITQAISPTPPPPQHKHKPLPTFLQTNKNGNGINYDFMVLGVVDLCMFPRPWTFFSSDG